MDWCNVFLPGAALFALWQYAVRRNLIDGTSETKEIVRAVRRRIVAAQLCYAIAAANRIFSTYLSVCLTILIQLNFAAAFFFNRHKQRR